MPRVCLAALDGPAVEKCIEKAGDSSAASFEEKLETCYRKADKIISRPDPLRSAVYLMEVATKWGAYKVGRMTQAHEKYLQHLLSSKRIKSTDLNTLQVLFEALDSLAFYTHAPAHVRELKIVYEELIRRVGPNTSVISAYYKKLVTVRLLDDARALAKKFPLFEALPKIETHPKLAAGQPALYEAAEDGNGLRLVPSPLGSGARLVIVTHPRCHFSVNAFKDISSDPELMELLKKHALLIAAQERFDMEGLSDWNKKYPDLHQKFVYLEKDWPKEIDWKATPHFHFFKDGKLVRRVNGWASKKKSTAEIREGFVRLGLIKK